MVPRSGSWARPAALLGFLAALACTAPPPPGTPSFSTAPLAVVPDTALRFRGRILDDLGETEMHQAARVAVPWASPGEAPVSREAVLLLPRERPRRPEDRFAVILAGSPSPDRDLVALFLGAGGIVLRLEETAGSIKPAVDWVRARFLLAHAQTGVVLADAAGDLLHSALEHAGFVVFCGTRLVPAAAALEGLLAEPAPLLWLESGLGLPGTTCRQVCEWRRAGLEVTLLAAPEDEDGRRLPARCLEFLDQALRHPAPERQYAFQREIAGHVLRLWIRARDGRVARAAAEAAIGPLQRAVFSLFPGQQPELPPLEQWLAPAVRELEDRGLPACLLLDESLAVARGPPGDDSSWCIDSLDVPAFPPALLRDAVLWRVALAGEQGTAWLRGSGLEEVAAVARELAQQEPGEWPAYLEQHPGVSLVSGSGDAAER